MALTWNRLYSFLKPKSFLRHKAFFTTPNSLREEDSLTKSVYNVFGSKQILHAFFKRRVSDGSWKLCKFENWRFELIQGGNARTRYRYLLQNKII